MLKVEGMRKEKMHSTSCRVRLVVSPFVAISLSLYCYLQPSALRWLNRTKVRAEKVAKDVKANIFDFVA
jgi:hypothetical protein